MKIVDLSHALDHSTQVYPGDNKFSCCPTSTIDSFGFNVMSLNLSTHTGTHVDAPYHMIKDGAQIPALDLALFQGPALIIDVRGKKPREKITWHDLVAYEPRMQKGTIVLLHTGWSAHWQTSKYNDHPFLGHLAAEGLVNAGIRTIGIDTFSPDETPQEGEKPASDFHAHQVILGAGGVIAENLTNLDAVTFEDPIVSFFPLKITDGDGSPVRAVAWNAGSK